MIDQPIVDLDVFRASLDAGVLLNLTHWRALVEELEVARKAREELVRFHDEYDSDWDRFTVRDRLWRILAAWGGVGEVAGGGSS